MIQVHKIDPAELNLKDQVVSINRVTKVVKGGKNLSFSALVVVGDPEKHVVGYAKGKAKEVPAAIRKAIEKAKKNLMRVHTARAHHPARRARPLWRRAGAAEAGPRRQGHHRRGAGARGRRGGGHSERADQIDRLEEPAQRHQGDLRSAPAATRPQ